MRMAACLILVAILARLLFPAESARAEDYVQPEAAGLGREAVAVVAWGGFSAIEVIAIDDVAITARDSPYAGSRLAVLLPGRHNIRAVASHGGSPMRCGISSSRSGVLLAKLQPGATYDIRTDKSSVTCAIYLWLEDRATKEPIAGNIPAGDTARALALAETQAATVVEKAYDDLRAKAEAGDAAAMHRLALWHLVGDEPLAGADRVGARNWLERAGAAGDDSAATTLDRLAAVDAAIAGVVP